MSARTFAWENRFICFTLVFSTTLIHLMFLSVISSIFSGGILNHASKENTITCTDSLIWNVQLLVYAKWKHKQPFELINFWKRKNNLIGAADCAWRTCTTDGWRSIRSGIFKKWPDSYLARRSTGCWEDYCLRKACILFEETGASLTLWFSCI